MIFILHKFDNSFHLLIKNVKTVTDIGIFHYHWEFYFSVQVKSQSYQRHVCRHCSFRFWPSQFGSITSDCNANMFFLLLAVSDEVNARN